MDDLNVILSDSAVSRVKQMIQDRGEESMLRVYVEGGGCSGFQYGFEFDKEAAEDDMQLEKEGVTLLVDPLSYQYLNGSTVDFIDDLSGARFVVNNPNASTTCGCGSSFSI